MKFKDFMMFMPGSLKSIAQAFQLPIQKRDFPHRFHTPTIHSYIGPLPPIHTPDDYFSLQLKKR